MPRRHALLAAILVVAMSAPVAAETKAEYATRFVMVLDWVKKTSNYMRDHLNDKGLARHLQDLAARQVEESGLLTPPEEWKPVHPHLILVAENAERAFFFVEKGDMAGYRRHTRIVREEIRILETLLDKQHLQLPAPPQ